MKKGVNEFVKKYKWKKINKYNKHRKFKNPKISYIFNGTSVLFIIFSANVTTMMTEFL